MPSKLHSITRYTGLWVTLILSACGLLFRLSGATALGNAIFLLGTGSGLGWGIGWLNTNESLTRPLRQLLAAAETLITKDNLALTDALAALAQGNLTAHATLDMQTLSAPGSGEEVGRLAGVLNTMISQLKDSAREFNNVTDEPCQRLFYVGSDPYL